MDLRYYNAPQPQLIVNTRLPQAPLFVSYQPDFEGMQKVLQHHGAAKHVIIIGHGGSITSFAAMAGSLIERVDQAGKSIHIVQTVDPDFIARVKAVAAPAESVVIAISKSGETVTQIEALLQFIDYPIICVTGNSGPLFEIGTKLNATMVSHPVIGGRFTGFTEVALLPAALVGLDIAAIFQAGRELHGQYSTDNPAWQAASIMHQLEQKGVDDVFMPIYSAELYAMSNLIMQLCHESFGKGGHGQTYLPLEAPEWQHHTTQRFYGGQRNVAGWFMSVDHPLNPGATSVPETLQSIPLRGGTMQNLHAIPLAQAMDIEMTANAQHTLEEGIPYAHMRIEQRSETEIGEMIAFWQMYAVYSAVLREVDPFNQPQVEYSKKISFEKRLGYGK